MRVKKKPVTPAPAETGSAAVAPALRRYLYVTAAITGAAIMIVEILGAKMLSPYLGTSHFVWTAQIAVTLVALACGYYAGGWLVDRSLQLGRLYACILLAGLYLALTIGLREAVAYQFLGLDLALGSLLSSAVLFFPPLALLAMVGPFCVRILTDSVSGVGGNVGRLTALSTLGSFVGTVLIGYLLIPHLPNSLTMYFTALVLAGISCVYFLIWGRGTRSQTTALAALVGAAALGYGGVRSDRWNSASTEELFRGNSNFGLLQVLQQKDGAHRYYLNDYLTQNTYDVTEKKSISMFTYMLHGLARAYAPQVSRNGTAGPRLDRVLCVGMGVGIVPMAFAHEGAQVDIVEINPAVLPVAANYFNFDPSKVTIRFADGRQYLNQCATQYDAIILDAFLGDSCPSHLMTREAFTAMSRALKPDGVLVMNTFAELEGERDFFGASLYKTLTNVFASVRIHSGRNGNTLFVGSNQAQLTCATPDLSGVYSGCAAQVKEAFATLREPDPAHGQLLTDDFNPVEARDAANREALRRMLALSAKQR